MPRAGGRNEFPGLVINAFLGLAVAFVGFNPRLVAIMVGSHSRWYFQSGTRLSIIYYVAPGMAITVAIVGMQM